MIRAYLFALDPTEAQSELLRSHCGAQRFAYNFGLALIRANLDQRAAERTYGLAEEDLTPAVSWSAFSLRRVWNAAKADVAPWWAENSKEAYSSGLANLARALSNWSASRSGKRAGPRVSFPPVEVPSQPVELPVHHRVGRIGLVRTHESTRKLARRLETGIARIRSATVSFQRGRWHVALSVELADPVPARRSGARVVGVDVGVKSLAVLSTGEVVPNPRHLDNELGALRRAQRKVSRRRGPDRRTRARPSNRWRKATTRVSALHTRIANQRRDGLHKLTTRLVRNHDTIVVEDLHVAGMVRNHHLARAISQLGLAELRRQIEYKATDAGVRVVVANRWYPSSKTCSACGAVKTKLTLAQRQFTCESCGTRLDRDRNAARNLAALASQVVHGQLDRDVKQPAGNPHQTAPGGTGYRHGKTQIMSQRRPREVATP